MEYKDLKPTDVFHWFYALNQIPRCSGDEKRVSDFFVDFAKERNLEVHQDEAHNVYIKKPASKGSEGKTPVIIQGHMDMVCVRGQGSNHDFACDPITMVVDGEYLRADNTTLGGDDGIAVAMGLALLDGDYTHPPLEVLITTSEETGMFGAQAVDKKHLEGKYLLNIDSEEEGVFYVSCAGGSTQVSEWKIAREEVELKPLRVTIDGLHSGHSGMEIVKQYKNAIILKGRLLHRAQKECDIRLGSVLCEGKHNAIAKSCTVEVFAEDVAALERILKREWEKMLPELRVSDPEGKLVVETSQATKAFTKELSDALLRFMFLIPSGVREMSLDMHGLVQTSSNPGVFEEKEGVLRFVTSVRSNVPSQLEDLYDLYKEIAALSGAEKTFAYSSYPAWVFEPTSPLLETAKKVYHDYAGEEAVIKAIHAGLECGILKEKLPDTYMLSYGPNLYDVHTAGEKMEIKSVERVFEFTKRLLEALA